MIHAFFKTVVLSILLLLSLNTVQSKDLDIQNLPKELDAFMLPGYVPLFATEGDLRGEGRSDYLLVLTRDPAPKDIPPGEPSDRALIILTRQPDGTLVMAARNDHLVYSSQSGGMMGDPFQGAEIKKKQFSVFHYGGSGWRWNDSYTFTWSAKDKTWLLSSFTYSSFHSSDPEKVTDKKHYTVKDFGKLPLETFDSDKFQDKMRETHKESN